MCGNPCGGGWKIHWQCVMLIFLDAGADTAGMGRSAAALCARVVAGVLSLGKRQCVRPPCTQRIKPRDTEVMEEME